MALFVRYFAILVHGLRAQIWLETWPDRGPHSGHSRYGPANLEPDTLEPGEVLDLAHHNLHLGFYLTFLVKVFDKAVR